jgi:hypothetical protein
VSRSLAKGGHRRFAGGRAQGEREGRRGLATNPPRALRLSREKEEHTMLNAGTLDRTIRVVLGLALVSLVFVGPRSLWGLVGLVPIATGAIGFCPLYRVLGIDTRGAQAGKAA